MDEPKLQQDASQEAQATETLLDLASPPLEPRQAGPSPLSSALKIGAIFFGAIIVAYVVLTGPSLWIKLQYFLSELGGAESEAPINLEAPPQELAAAIGTALTGDRSIPREPEEQPPASPNPAQPSQPRAPLPASDQNVAENMLVVPKIKVRVPIVWNSTADESTLLANLQHGVVHYGFTALPNTESGNVFLSGHSSYYWWDPGKYKTVFALLDRLRPGDQAFLKYQDTVYAYQVRTSVVVDPSDVSVTNPTREPMLSLMTCVPVGTSLRRLVIQADLVRAVALSELSTTLAQGNSH